MGEDTDIFPTDPLDAYINLLASAHGKRFGTILREIAAVPIADAAADPLHLYFRPKRAAAKGRRVMGECGIATSGAALVTSGRPRATSPRTPSPYPYASGRRTPPGRRP